jgi:hypothetical protein
MRPFAWVVCCVLAYGCTRKPGELSFDAAGWQGRTSNVGAPPTVRERMVSDVVTRTLPGKTKLEIEQLLGPSLETSYFKSERMDLIYFLGPEQGLFSVDSEWLLIWLDAGSRFKGAAVKRD